MFKRFAAVLSASFLLAGTPPAEAAAYDGHPKLVVLLVIDQFRADYLQRFRAEFKTRNGFRLFLDRGAYFPDCYYGYANTKTAPGHATLGTGAYSDGHGINSNQWWDLSRNPDREITSVEDARYGLVFPPGMSAPAAQSPIAAPQPGGATPAAVPETAAPAGAKSPAQAAPGASPRNLLASTFGDELRLATAGESRVYGVSLKDRAAILPAGAAANGAFWIDEASGRFITSTYYMRELPSWAAQFDNGPIPGLAAEKAGVGAVTDFYHQVGPTPVANAYELAFSEALIAGEQLGSHPTTDVLTISLSANDLEGHRFGPDSPEEHAMVLALDRDLNGFANWLEAHIPGGLANVVMALSADHGIAPTPAVSSALGLPGAYVDVDKLTADLNQAMNAKFSPGEKVVYLFPHQELPYLSLNPPAFERAGIIEQEAEDAVKTAMAPAFQSLAAPPAPPPQPEGEPPVTVNPVDPATGLPKPTTSLTVTAAARPAPDPQLFRAYTRQELAAGQLPDTEFGRMLARSYSPNGGWYVAAFPLAFQMGGAAPGANHFSPYSYDRHVPLGLFGAPFLPGTYRGRVEPTDIAATLSSVLAINQPSASVGHILTQALKPVGEYPFYPKPPVRRTRRGAKPAPEEQPSLPDLPLPALPDTAPPAPSGPQAAPPAQAAPATPEAPAAPQKPPQ